MEFLEVAIWGEKLFIKNNKVEACLDSTNNTYLTKLIFLVLLVELANYF